MGLSETVIAGKISAKLKEAREITVRGIRMFGYACSVIKFIKGVVGPMFG